MCWLVARLRLDACSGRTATPTPRKTRCFALVVDRDAEGCAGGGGGRATATRFNGVAGTLRFPGCRRFRGFNAELLVDADAAARAVSSVRGRGLCWLDAGVRWRGASMSRASRPWRPSRELKQRGGSRARAGRRKLARCAGTGVVANWWTIVCGSAETPTHGMTRCALRCWSLWARGGAARAVNEAALR